MTQQEDDKPKAFWVFSIRVGTIKPNTKTTKMMQRIAKQVGEIAGVVEVEVAEDFSKDPLLPILIKKLKVKTE